MREAANNSIDIEVIPDSLVERDQWVCWREEERDGKQTKVPLRPGTGAFASTTDPETWTSFEEALDYVRNDDVAGLGFIFSDEDPIVGVDLDDCRNPETGDLDSTAADIVDRLDSYTEISPSGTGFHVLVEGTLPDGRNRRGSVELYDSARFFTVTGDHVDGTPTRVARRQDAVEGIHRDYVQDDEPEDAERNTDGDQEVQPNPSRGDVDLEDAEVVLKARNAGNGEKFEQLWNGNTAGYDSHSEADMALCCLLAFWTGGDRSQMDRLFRQSDLMRDKWDEVHYADGSTYGEKTIERATSTVTEHYDCDASTRSDPAMIQPLKAPGRGSSSGPRNIAYLTEQTRLLRDRLDELQGKLEEKEERINELEAKLR